MLWSRRSVRVVLLVVLVWVMAAGCGGPRTGTGTGAGAGRAAESAIRRAVADRAREPSARPAGIPLEEWSYGITSVRRDGDRATVRADLHYRLTGYDTAPGGSARELDLGADLGPDGRPGSWRVRADRPAPGAPQQLWDQGPVTVVRGRRSLVLAGAGAEAGQAAAVAAEADRAVPAASAAWPRPWAGKAVVLLPGSLDGMARLLGRPADTYRGLGAVTTGRAGQGPGPPDRVVINPEGWAQLGETGRRVVLTHEITHVATRAATTATTPMWLSEGFADWAAYRDGSTTPQQGAPELARAVRRGEIPTALPDAGAFAFGGDPEASARAYGGAWLACRLIAEQWGEAALRELYERAGREPLPTALHATLGVDGAQLTRVWQEALRRELR